MEREKAPYFGSVRFCKHVILTTIALLIAIPTALTGILLAQNLALRANAAGMASPGEGEITSEPPAVTADLQQEEETPQLTVEVPPWQSLFPDLYAQPCQRSSVDEEKVAYLTFDDGPTSQTPNILKVLDDYDIKATFFVIGREDEQSKQWLRDIADAGHTIGIHSYSHDYKTIYSSVEALLEDYDKLYRLIYEVTGEYPQICRFPGGSINGYNGTTYRDMIAELVRRGFVYFDWNVATGDAVKGVIGAQTLADNCLRRADSVRRAVILAHDSPSRTTTVEALPAIIEGYLEAGFTFAPLTPEVVPVVYSYPS